MYTQMSDFKMQQHASRIYKATMRYIERNRKQLGVYSVVYYTKGGFQGKIPAWAGIEFQSFLLCSLRILHLDISNPFRANSTKCLYSNNRYFSKLLRVKLNKEFNGANFEAISLVCRE
jgi:hypothetical protein